MIDILEQAAREAGDVLLKFFQKELVTQEKGSHHNLVTEADIASQNKIKDSLLAGATKLGLAEKDIGFIGEEQGMNSRAKYTFVIDPLDGTNNFSAGLDVFGITIALLEDEQITCGILYFPMKNELISAERGRGAFLKTSKGSKKLSIEPAPMKTKMLGECTTSDAVRQTYLFAIRQKLLPLFLGNRVTGCMIYDFAQLVLNVFGAEYAYGPRLWDVAAGKLIIEEAGGVMVDFEGQELALNLDEPDTPHEFIAVHPKNLPAILAALKA